MSAEVSFDLSPVTAWLDEAFALVPTLDGGALDAALRSAETVRRRADALCSAVIGRGDEVRRSNADGHRRTSGWVASQTSAGAHESSTRARVADALARMPNLRAAFELGVVPFEVVEVITRRIRDDRVAERLVRDDEALTTFARGRTSDEMRRAMAGWDQLADPLGAAEAAADAHRRRRVRIVRTRGEVRIHATFGAAQGEEIASVLDRYAQREFATDAAHAVDGELPRTADQRAADGFGEAMATADAWFETTKADCPECGAPVPTPKASRDPLVNLVFDADTFRQWAEGAAWDGPINLDRLRTHAARTSDGHPVPVDDIVRAMIIGKVRIAVRRSDGVITHIGRRQRLFRGLRREAVVLQDTNCGWDGCHVPGSRCEADHLQPYRDGGTTETDNGGLACDHHNRWRSKHGYRIIRDHDGRLHVVRPDGSPISGRPPPILPVEAHGP